MENKLPQRKNIRIKKFDYSSNGAYFITICAYQRKNIFGEITTTDNNQNVGQGLCSCRLSPIGIIIDEEIQNLVKRYCNIEINKYVIMPNHLHMILCINKSINQCLWQEQSPCPTISDMVCTMKSIATKRVNKTLIPQKIWQPRFYGHIIRGEADYLKIWKYIDTNQIKWELDCYYKQDNHKVQSNHLT